MRKRIGLLWVLAIAVVASGSYVAGTFHKSSGQALAATSNAGQGSNVTIKVQKTERLSQWQNEHQPAAQPQANAVPSAGVQAGISPDQVLSLLQQLVGGGDVQPPPGNGQGHGKGHVKHEGHGDETDGQGDAQSEGND